MAEAALRMRAEPSTAQLARWAISDTLVMTRRNLLVWMRVPAYIVFTVVQPVIFVLLFRYVFGGAIRVPGGGSYVDIYAMRIDTGGMTAICVLQHTGLPQSP